MELGMKRNAMMLGIGAYIRDDMGRGQDWSLDVRDKTPSKQCLNNPSSLSNAQIGGREMTEAHHLCRVAGNTVALIHQPRIAAATPERI